MQVEIKILLLSAAVNIVRELGGYLYHKLRCEMKLALKTPSAGANRKISFDVENPTQSEIPVKKETA